MEAEAFPAWATKNTMEKDAFTAWMYGRMAVSAKAAGYRHSPEEAQNQAYTYILRSGKNPMSAWAYAYIAQTMNKNDYEAYKQKIIEYALSVDNMYTNALKIDGMPGEKAARLNALWTWTMVAQAAAHRGDRENYVQALSHLAEVLCKWRQEVHKKEFPENAELPDVLLAAMDPNDYPGWLLANLLDAYKMMEKKVGSDIKDKFPMHSMKNLERVLQQAIGMAATPVHDKMLAQVVRALALAQHPTLRPVVNNANEPQQGQGTSQHVQSAPKK